MKIELQNLNYSRSIHNESVDSNPSSETSRDILDKNIKEKYPKSKIKEEENEEELKELHEIYDTLSFQSSKFSLM